MAVKVSITCNVCGKEGESDKGPDRVQAHSMRWWLKQCGWRVGLPGGRDICWKCRKLPRSVLEISRKKEHEIEQERRSLYDGNGS